MEKKAKGKKMGSIGHLFGVKWVEKFIEFTRGIFSEKILDFTLKWALIFGHFALIVAAVLGLLFAIIYAIRVNDFYAFLYGIAWVILIFVVQYIAHKFSDAGENLIKNNPTRLSSKAFLDCVAFIFMIAGLVIFIVSVINLIKNGVLEIFLTGLGMAVFCEFIAMVSFHYRTITMEVVNKTTAGQEAIGIITFFMKALLKLVPLFFGVGVVLGTIILFINSFGLFGNQIRTASAWISGNHTAEQILMAGILPFVAYIVFVLYYLVIDIITAILSLPGKIDSLKK
jgi:hypothetical protein